MTRVYNFSAGPAMLPHEVMEQAQAELLDFRGTGMSVMELSHRSEAFMAVAEQAEADLRSLLSVPQDYSILFLQGGATTQFAMVPLNLLGRAGTGNYVNTGYWSAKAIREAGRFGNVHICADGAADEYRSIPPPAQWQIDPAGAYLHYTPNETIGGVEFHDIPDSDGLPLVADMSSTLLSRPLEVSRFALIYAGAQKNIGPAGLTVVLLRDEVLQDLPAGTPSMLDYRAHRGARSMYNTPNTFAWYIAGLVFSWVKRQGGLQAMAERNQAKADRLYAAIDGSSLYHNRIHPSCRSRMNIPFQLADPDLDGAFLRESQAAGLVNLGGHRSVGGMRASLYNAMPLDGVDTLIQFMSEFERRH